MKRENYVAPSIKVLEIGQELLLEEASGSSLPIDPEHSGTGTGEAKENDSHWDDEDATPTNAWRN